MLRAAAAAVTQESEQGARRRALPAPARAQVHLRAGTGQESSLRVPGRAACAWRAGEPGAIHEPDAAVREPQAGADAVPQPGRHAARQRGRGRSGAAHQQAVRAPASVQQRARYPNRAGRRTRACGSPCRPDGSVEAHRALRPPRSPVQAQGAAAPLQLQGVRVRGQVQPQWTVPGGWRGQARAGAQAPAAAAPRAAALQWRTAASAGPPWEGRASVAPCVHE